MQCTMRTDFFTGMTADAHLIFSDLRFHISPRLVPAFRPHSVQGFNNNLDRHVTLSCLQTKNRHFVPVKYIDLTEMSAAEFSVDPPKRLPQFKKRSGHRTCQFITIRIRFIDTGRIRNDRLFCMRKTVSSQSRFPLSGADILFRILFICFDRKIKKDAFYLYKAYWSKQPFVHTCGSRYVDRTEDVTEVRVYSNLPEVSLYKDGHLVETKKGDKVFVFNVPITGKHSIEARAGAYSSVILVNKVAEPNPAYAMSNRQVVNNWFDGELDETCWSVKDNMAAAMADAKVGPVLKAITDKAAAARGDVAAAVKDNPALVAMMERAMQRMTVESMLKQAGTDAESIKQLNRVLQGIKKDV